MAESVYYRFTTQSLPDDTFTVVRFTGEEAISDLYRFQIDLITNENALDVEALHDTPSTLTISAGGHERVVQGIITQTEVLDQPNGVAIYRVELRPRVWELSVGVSHKVYIDARTPDVIEQVMERAGITETDFALELDEDYREWEFRLQYGESFWHFLSRILERDGIYYYFTAGDEVEKVHFCDAGRHQPTISQPELHFSTALGLESPESGETVHAIVERHKRPLKKITLQNYNDAKPSTRITADIEVDPNGTGEANIYGQKVLDQAEADALAEVRAQEIRAQKAVYHGESTVSLLSPAHRFTLDGHPRTNINTEYQVISIEHSGHDPRAARLIGEEPDAGTPAYENRFTAIAATVQYRHPQRTMRPGIQGTINARVDSAGDGQYAELDDEGRYHIVFPFDTEHSSGKASHWVRMMQPYAGEREGIHFPLRKGARVLISFLDGDPDLPVINGAVTNSEQPSTTTADNQTCSTLRTAGGNCLEADDNRGREWMQLSSERRRTKFRMGAGPNVQGRGNSVGAADASGPILEDSIDPDADGALIESDHMFRAVYFGGENSVRATRGWAIHETLWPDSVVRRDDALNMEEADQDPREVGRLREYDGDDWRIRHGINEVFRFPRKHLTGETLPSDASSEPGSDEFVTAHEEAKGNLLIRRDLGDSYTYRSGTSFTFFGPDHETFDFGPTARFSASDHETSAEDLRQIVLDSIMPEGQGDLGAAKSRLDDARDEVEAAEETLEERTERFEELTHQAEDLATARPIITTDIGFEDESILEEWLQLNNCNPLSQQGHAIWTFPTPPPAMFSGSFTPSYWLVDESDLTKALEPRDGSIADARLQVNQAKTKYEQANGEYKAISTGEITEWSSLLRQHRISVNKLDQAMWHEGNIYDFGGHRRFNFGGSYSENHVSGAPAPRKLNSDDHDHDVLKSSGPGGTNCEWTGKLDSSVKGKLDGSGNASISKTIGDTYSYHDGVAISVHKGAVHLIREQGPRAETEYSGGEKARELYAENRGTTEKKYNGNGDLIFYERDGFVTGHETFTFEAEWQNSIAINADASFDFALNMAASMEIEIGFAAKTKFAFDFSASFELSLKAGTYTEMKVPLLNHNEIKLCKGLAIKVEKTPLTLEIKNGKVTVTTADGTELNKFSTIFRANTHGLSMEKLACNIAVKSVDLFSGLKINS